MEELHGERVSYKTNKKKTISAYCQYKNKPLGEGGRKYINVWLHNTWMDPFANGLST